MLTGAAGPEAARVAYTDPFGLMECHPLSNWPWQGIAPQDHKGLRDIAPVGIGTLRWKGSPVEWSWEPKGTWGLLVSPLTVMTTTSRRTQPHRLPFNLVFRLALVLSFRNQGPAIPPATSLRFHHQVLVGK